MHICFVTPRFGGGGCGNYLSQLVYGLMNCDQNLRVTVVTTDKVYETIKFDMDRLRFIKTDVRLSNIGLFPHQLEFGRQARDIISHISRNDSIDVLHVNETSYGTLLTLGRPIRQVPILMTAHLSVGTEIARFLEVPTISFGDKFIHCMYHVSTSFFENYNVRKADRIITVTEGIRQALTKKYPHYAAKFQTIPNVVDTGILLQEKDDLRAREFREFLDPKDDTCLLLYAGSLVARKNLGVLIRATKHLLDQGNKVKTVLAGDGNKRRELADLAGTLGTSGNIYMPGNLTHCDVMNLMGACDIFVSPSIYETPSLAILEAMASGLPVVAAFSPDIPEIIKHEYNGLFFNLTRNAEQECAKQILRLIYEDNVRKKIVENEISTIKSMDIDASVEKTLELFYESMHKCKVSL